MEITTLNVQARVPVTILRVKGDFDSQTYEAFDVVAWQAILKGGTRDLIVNLTEVPYMTSAGLRSINSAYKLLHPVDPKGQVAPGLGGAKSPHMKLVNPSPRVRQTLVMGGFDQLLEIYATEQEALAAF